MSTWLSASRPASSGTTYAFNDLMLALLRSTRPVSSLVPGTLTSVAIFVKAGFSVRGILAGLAMFSLTAFGFQINDLLDYQKDKAAGVQRPIATGALSSRTAAAFAFALLLFAFSLSVLVGSGLRVLAATALLLVLYTPFARKFPLFKGLYVAILCISPLYYGSQVSGVQYPSTPYVLLSLFIVGREALMDSNEVCGDRSAGMITIAVLLGETLTKRAGTLVMLLSLAGLATVAVGDVARFAAITALVSLLCVIAWPHLDDTKRISLSRIPMLAAGVALACG